MSGVKYHSKRSNIIPGGIPVKLPIETDIDGNTTTNNYNAPDYKGCFGFHENDSGVGVMYYSDGQEWVTMDRVPILKPSARTPTTASERGYMRLTPFISGEDFDNKHTRTAFQVFLDEQLTIQYKSRFDFIINGVFGNIDNPPEKLTKVYLYELDSSSAIDCGYLLYNKIDGSTSNVFLVDIPATTKSLLDSIESDNIENYSLRLTPSGTNYPIVSFVSRVKDDSNIWSYLPLSYEYNDNLGIVLIGDKTQEGNRTFLSQLLLPPIGDGFDFGQSFYWKGKYFGGPESGGNVDEQYESVWSTPFLQQFPKTIEDPLPITKNGIRTDRLQISKYDSAFETQYPHTQTIWKIYNSLSSEQPLVTITKSACSDDNHTTNGESPNSVCKRFLKFSENENKDFQLTSETGLTVLNHNPTGDDTETLFTFVDGQTYYWSAQYKSSSYETLFTTRQSFVIPEKDMILKFEFNTNDNIVTLDLPLYWNLSNISSDPIIIQFSRHVKHDDTTSDEFTFNTNRPSNNSSDPLKFIITDPNAGELTATIKYRDYSMSSNYIYLMNFFEHKDDSTPSESNPIYRENGMAIDSEYASFMQYLSSVVSFGKHIKYMRFSNCQSLTKVSEYLPNHIDRLTKFFAGCTNFNQDLDNWDTSNILIDISPKSQSVWYNREFDRVFLNASKFNGNISTWQISNIFGSSELKNYSNDPIFCIGMFKNAIAFNRDISSWNMTKVINMSNMFEGCQAFNGDLSKWNVSSVTDLSYTFKDTTVFNSDISDWVVSSVTSMEGLFENSKNFNSDLSKWGYKLDAVNTFSKMFKGSEKFNSNISSWVFSSTPGFTIDMSQMFMNAYEFDSDISDWNIDNVTNMDSMFKSSQKFNQDLSSWGSKLSNVTSMNEMFMGAIVFNSNINGWNVSKVSNFNNMFTNCELFDGSLSGWTFSSGDPLEENNQTMVNMFKRCLSFTGKGLSTWNVSRVNTVKGMFEECSNFIGKNLQNWESINSTTANITDFSRLFYKAIRFNQPIGSWDTSSATNMSEMFYSANIFNQDLNNWDVSNVTDMTAMFYRAGLFGKSDDTFSNPDPVKDWKTTSLTKASGLFYLASEFNSELTATPEGKWDMSKVTSFTSMFRSTNKFQGKGLSTWSTNSNTSLSNTFANAKAYNGTAIGLNTSISNWNTSNVTNMNNCFYGTSIIGNVDLSGWDVRKILDFSGAFESSNFNGNITTWRLYNNENGANSRIDMTSMFRDNRSFTQNISYDETNNYWNTSYVNNMTTMFYRAINFNGDISGWKTQNVISMTSMFRGINDTTSGRHKFNQNISNWDVSNVIDMSNMFEFANSFNQPIGSWGSKTSKVRNMKSMFGLCRAFNQDLSSWNTSSVTDMSFMFNGASTFNNGGSPDIINWNTSRVNYMTSMFDGAKAFKQALSSKNASWDFSSLTSTKTIQPLQNFLRDVTFNHDGNGLSPLDYLYIQFVNLLTTTSPQYPQGRLGKGWQFHEGRKNILTKEGEDKKAFLTNDTNKWFIVQQTT